MDQTNDAERPHGEAEDNHAAVRFARVERRAYELWQAAGEPEGSGEDFWHKAEAELSHEEQSGTPA